MAEARLQVYLDGTFVLTYFTFTDFLRASMKLIASKSYVRDNITFFPFRQYIESRIQQTNNDSSKGVESEFVTRRHYFFYISFPRNYFS